MKFFNKKEKQSRTLAFASLLIGILLTYNTFTAYSNIQLLNETHKEQEWNSIVSTLTENEDKATIQANFIRENIKKDLVSAYENNMNQLSTDMQELDVNSDFLKILNKNIEGKYLNTNNDNNDLFVMSTWNTSDNIDLKGAIITDKSINCSKNGEIRTFDVELGMHSNYNLGYDALKKVLTLNKEKPIFWEFLTSTNPEHKQVDISNLDSLKEVYMSEGMAGLKTYEILNPVYINDSTDIFGSSKVDNLGSLNNTNRQIIVVQGFSLYDALMVNHSAYQLAEKDYVSLTQMFQAIGIFGDILIFVVFLSIAKVQNLVVELEDLEQLRNEVTHTKEKKE